MTQTNRNQDPRKALEARVAALEAELAACKQAHKSSEQSAKLTPSSAETQHNQVNASAWQPVVASLVQHTLLPTAVFDTEVRYVAASEGWLEAYGLQDRDIVGMSHYDLFPDIGDDWKAIHARCLAGAHESRTEDAFARTGGGMDWITWSVYPWYDSQGDIAGLVMSTAIVTEQVLARENERIFRQLVEAASDGIVMSDLDDTIRYANPAYKAMLELDPEVELRGQSLDVYSSSDLGNLNATMRREGAWRGVIEQRRLSGATFPAEVTAFVMRDEVGALTRRAAIYRDISSERRMLTALTHSSQQLQVIMQSLPVVLFATDTEGTITLSEGQALPLLGLRPGEVVGRSIFEYYAAKQDVVNNVKRALQGQATTFDMYFADQDLYFQRHFAPLYGDDGQVTGMLGIGYDITDRKRAEVDLDAWKHRYDLIVASSGQVVYEYDIATSDITWSGSIKSVLGFDLADMAGGIDRWMALIHPADVAGAVAALEHAQDTASAYNIEYRFANAQGHYVPMVDRGFFITDENGIAITMLGMMQDISDRKRAEQDLKLFRTLVASATDGILLTNPDGTIAYSNEAYDTLLGLNRADVDSDFTSDFTSNLASDIDSHLRGELAEVSLSANGKATLVEAVGDILTRGRWEGFIEHQHQQGHPIPTLMTSFAINDEETGELQYVASIVKDVTAQQDAQDRLVASERRLQILVANLPVILFATDKDGIVTLSEGQALKDIGLRAGEIVGLSIFDYYQDMPVIIDNATRALAGEATTFEVYYAKTDEYFERYFAPLNDKDGNVTGMLGIGYNISERKRANEALKAERERFFGLYQAVPDTIIRMHYDGTFLDYKPSSYFASYVDPKDTIGKNMRDNVSPDVVEQAFASLHAAITTGEMQKFENVLTVNGETRYRENRFVKLNDEEAIAIVRDVTDLRSAEQASKASQQRLQAILAKLPVIVFTIDQDGIFTMSEGKGLIDIGLQPGQVVATSAFDVFADYTDALHNVRRALAGEAVTAETFLLGQMFESHYTPLLDEAGVVTGMLVVAYNITERKQAENALRDSQQLLEDAQRLGRIGAWVFDLAEQKLTWSEQVYEQFEVDPNTELTLEFAVSFYIDVDPLQAAMARAIEQAEPYELELEITTTSGERRWVVSIGNAIVEDGQVVSLQGIQQDITERKQAENALRESQQQLERAQRVANFGNFAIGVADMRISASTHALSMHELPQDTPLSLSDLVPLMSAADFRKVQSTIEQSVVEAREASVEYTLQLPSGARRDIHAIWQTSQDDRGEVYQIFGTVQDITWQKQAESALLENQRLLEDAQRIGAMGSWSLEVATGSVTWSKQTYALLEIDEGQPLTLELVMSSYVDPSVLQTALEQAISQAQPYDIEAEVVTGSGQHRWVRVMGNPLVEDGEIVRVTGIIQDISDIKQAEAELQNANSHLARVNHIGSRLQAESSLKGMLEAVLEPLEAPANAMIFYAHNDSDDPHTMTAIELAACYRDTAIPLGITFQLADYPWTQVYLDNPHETFIVSNVYQDARINELAHPVFAEFDFTTLIIVPLVQGGAWTGIFQMGWSQERPLSAGEHAYFNALPTLLAPAITNRRLLDNLEQTISQRTAELQDQLTETARFKSIVEATADLVSYGDLDGNILYLNPAGRRLLGYDEHAGRYLPNVSDVYDDAGNERFAAEVMPAVLESGVWRGETQVIGAGSEMIPVSQVVNVIPDEQGHVVGIGTVVRDISESKALEANLRQSNAVLTRLSELSQAFNKVASKQVLLEVAAALAFDEGAAAATLFDLDGQDHTGGAPETMTVAARSRADGQADDIPLGLSFTLAEFASAELWLDSPDRLLCVENIFEDDRIDEQTRRVLVETANTQAYVVVPLLQNNRWVGTFNFTWRHPHTFLARELQLYQALMTQVPPVLANLNIVADLEDLVAARSAELQASNEQLALINRISNELKAANSSDMMLEVLLEPLDRTASASLFYALTDDQNDMVAIELIARRSPLSEPPLGTVIQLQDFPSTQMWLDNPDSALIIADTAQDTRIDEAARAFYQQLNIAAAVSVPLRQSGEWVGVLFVTFPAVMTFSSNEQVYFNALPAMLAPPLANRRMVETLEDTVAKRSEELSRSRQLLRATIDNAPLVISVKDTELRYILANRNIHRVIPGATPRDVIGRKDSDLTDLVPAWKAQNVQARDLDILANKQVLNYETEREVNGEQRAFSVTKFPMLDENGDLFAIGTVATDISERKAADAKMQAYRDQIAKAETELRITQRIQELLLPASDELRAIDDLDIASYMQPAEQVGGDYYDVLHIGNRVKIGIGDVTGHGLESGLLMLMTQTAVRTLLSSDEHDAKRVMDILNRTVFANLQRMQVDKSLTLSLLDYNQGTLSLSGQHEHVLIMRRDGSVETIDTIDLGMPLGLEEDITRFIAEHVVHLQPGEGVVLFTDGITEAENDKRVQFGLPRLVELVSKHWHKSSEDIVYEIINAVYDHIAAHEVYDDITLIVFKRPPVTDALTDQKALVK